MRGEEQLNLQRHSGLHPHLCESPQAGTEVAFHVHKVGRVLMTPDDVSELVRLAVRICISGQLVLHGWWVICEEIRNGIGKFES